MGQAILEGFEKFAMKGRSFRPRLTIRTRGQIGFNNGAVQRFDLGMYDYVVLYFSKEKNQIALQLTNNKDEDGAVKLVKKTGNFFLSGKSFLDFYNIKYTEKALQYDIEMAGDNILLVNLKKEIKEK